LRVRGRLRAVINLKTKSYVCPLFVYFLSLFWRYLFSKMFQVISVFRPE
jgi:hypothetical protein